MIFHALTINNIGPFRGEHTFPLYAENEPAKNVVAVAGHNGAGKTTLYRLIPLALHGSLATGERTSAREYNDYLRDLLHRGENRSEAKKPRQTGAISVAISYIRSGIAQKATVTRTFQRTKSSVSESLHVDATEEPNGVADAQAWITDRIPLSHLDICFFDAEHLEGLLGAGGRSNHLRAALLRLLGIHLTDRLKDDLQNYIVRTGGTKSDKLREVLLSSVATRDATGQALDEVRNERASLATTIKEARRQLASLERSLAAEGGGYAEKRKQRQTELDETVARIEVLEARLREEAEGLLPFAYLSQYRASLEHALDLEESASDAQAEFRGWQERSKQLRSEFASLIAPRDRDSLLSVFDSAINAVESNAAHSSLERIRHDLRSSEAAQVRAWLAASGKEYRKQLENLHSELKQLRAKAAQLDQAIRRAPSDEQLAPMHASIEESQKHLDDLIATDASLISKEAKCEVAAQEAEASFQKARKEFEAVHASAQGIELAVRSRNVLETYRDALVQHKLNDIADTTVSVFNSVCMKENLLEQVVIDSKSFQSTLRGVAGETLLLDSFSAGERQLYNLALFFALRSAAHADLPLFIDTPFARLDDAHRQQLLDEFIPNVSKQVVLFTTDAEYEVLHKSGKYERLAWSHVLTSRHDSTTVEIEPSSPSASPVQVPA